jgi:endothelin-converting enzyme/putative endopeptidase
MARPFRRLLTALLFVSLPMATALTFGQGPAATSGLDLDAINRSVDPCHDFYLFACGEWVSRNPIPADRARWSRFDELQDRNNDVLRRILETATQRSTTATKKIGDYYASCMDEADIERKGIAPLAPRLAQVDALRDVAALPGLVAGLHAAGANVFFGFGSQADPKDARNNIASVG